MTMQFWQELQRAAEPSQSPSGLSQHIPPCFSEIAGQRIINVLVREVELHCMSTVIGCDRSVTSSGI